MHARTKERANIEIVRVKVQPVDLLRSSFSALYILYMLVCVQKKWLDPVAFYCPVQIVEIMTMNSKRVSYECVTCAIHRDQTKTEGLYNHKKRFQ